MSVLSKLEHECAELLKLRARLEEITVRSAARRIKKSPEYVRANFGVIVHGPKSHHVRVVDVEAYQEKRTVWPSIQQKIAQDLRLLDQKVWCHKCGYSRKVDPAVCLSNGWPLHCGETMSIDSPSEKRRAA